MDKDGNLPLGLALSDKQTPIAKILCEFKADVNAKDQNGWSLLQRAIQRGINFDLLLLLLSDKVCRWRGSNHTKKFICYNIHKVDKSR